MTVIKIAAAAALSLTLAASAAAQTPVPSWKLVEARDSFVLKLRGQELGFIVYAVEKTASGFRITENSRMGTMSNQVTEILLDTNQRLTSVKQSGQSRGQDARIELRYSNNHVKGSATVPSSTGALSHEIDMDVPENVIDDNLLMPVLSRLSWTATTAYTIPLFSAGKNGLTDMKLTVVGTDTVALPGGQVEAYKVEMRGDVVAVHFWVSTAAPHRMVKTVPMGSPAEIVLAN